MVDGVWDKQDKSFHNKNHPKGKVQTTEENYCASF